jgi:hypothetical protein
LLAEAARFLTEERSRPLPTPLSKATRRGAGSRELAREIRSRPVLDANFTEDEQRARVRALERELCPSPSPFHPRPARECSTRPTGLQGASVLLASSLKAVKRLSTCASAIAMATVGAHTPTRVALTLALLALYRMFARK